MPSLLTLKEFLIFDHIVLTKENMKIKISK